VCRIPIGVSLMPNRGANGAALLLSGPPARCQGVLSSAAATCRLPGDGLLLPPALLRGPCCLHDALLFLQRAEAQRRSLAESGSPLPLNRAYRGRAGTAPSPFWFPGRMADCDAISLPVPLYSGLSPVVISSHFQACHCCRRGR